LSIVRAGSVSTVSVRVQKEDIDSHLDLEFWTYTYSWWQLHRQFWTFWIYFADIKLSVLGINENAAHN